MRLILDVKPESMKLLIDLANIGCDHLEEGDFTQEEIDSLNPSLLEILDEIDKNVKTQSRTRRITRTRTYE